MTGYLITVAVVGCFTAIALWPPRRPRPLAQIAYFMGLTVNEVPHLAAGLPLAIATGQTIAAGELRLDARSSVPAVAASAVVVGLVAIARRGVRSWPVVAEAMKRAGLEAPDQPRRWVWRTLATPFPFRPRPVVRTAGLSYGEHRRQRLDVLHRDDRPERGPVLVYFHGGGYSSGSKHWEGRALLHRLAARGWVCISADYRLRPAAGFEEHLADARSALAWARDHAAGFGGDADRLVMAGSSAGAHLTSLLALEPDTDLAAAVCLYGYYGRYYGRTEDERQRSTPFVLPADGAPPFFVAHGDRDSWTPVGAARQLAAKLRRESAAPVVWAELPGGQHGFDLWRSWRGSAVVEGIDAFLQSVVAEREDRRESVGPVTPPA